MENSSEKQIDSLSSSVTTSTGFSEKNADVEAAKETTRGEYCVEPWGFFPIANRYIVSFFRRCCLKIASWYYRADPESVQIDKTYETIIRRRQ